MLKKEFVGILVKFSTIIYFYAKVPATVFNLKLIAISENFADNRVRAN